MFDRIIKSDYLIFAKGSKCATSGDIHVERPNIIVVVANSSGYSIDLIVEGNDGAVLKKKQLSMDQGKSKTNAMQFEILTTDHVIRLIGKIKGGTKTVFTLPYVIKEVY